MEFGCLIAFLVMYFFRPQEWMSFLSSLRPVQLITFFAVYSLFKREKGFKLSDIFKTPHDWLVFAYFIWTVVGSPSPLKTLTGIQSVIIIYIVAVQALSSVERIKTFLSWWALCLMGIAALALASQIGFDPFGSYDLTNGPMKGRLCLNLSIYDNPNGLGHTLVPVIPMVYVIWFWKRVIGKASLVFLVVPLWCILLTESKGAFICTFATILSTLTFGRPRTVQIGILIFAGLFGTALLYSLPRMNELQNSTKGNEAIGGRVAAFQFGYQCMNERVFGIGLGNFVGKFFERGPMEKFRMRKVINGQMRWVWGRRHYYKATHSAYNQNGAELGYGGLFLFVSILYSCMRTLTMMKSGGVEEERVRRALFSVVMSYVVSSWMVDFCYRPTFFMFVAACGALHRILRENQSEPVPEAQLVEPVLPAWKRRLQPAHAMAGVRQPQLAAIAEPVKRTVLSHKINLDQDEPELKGSIEWARLGWPDLGAMLGLTYLAVWVWRYSIDKF